MEPPPPYSAVVEPSSDAIFDRNIDPKQESDALLKEATLECYDAKLAKHSGLPTALPVEETISQKALYQKYLYLITGVMVFWIMLSLIFCFVILNSKQLNPNYEEDFLYPCNAEENVTALGPISKEYMKKRDVSSNLG